MAAHNWRALRQRGMEHGLGDLMVLPSMHVVLDMAESIGVESSLAGAKSESEARSELSSFYAKLYRPNAADMRTVNGTGHVEPPPGFSDDEVEASFDAFVSSLKTS